MSWRSVSRAVLRLSWTMAPGMPRRTTRVAGSPAVTIAGLATSVRAGVAAGDGGGRRSQEDDDHERRHYDQHPRPAHHQPPRFACAHSRTEVRDRVRDPL